MKQFLLFLFIAGFSTVAYSQSGIGVRENGEQLIFVQYMQADSLSPSNLTLDFFFDGSDKIRTITFVELQEQSDSNYREIILNDGGAGNGNNFINFTLGAIDATYYRVQSNYYGFNRGD